MLKYLHVLKYGLFAISISNPEVIGTMNVPPLQWWMEPTEGIHGSLGW